MKKKHEAPLVYTNYVRIHKKIIKLLMGSGVDISRIAVLEHVPFMSDSLKELHRVLKPNGALFIFHFPNRWSWTEWIASWHRLSGHSRKLTLRELHTALVCNGFDVESSWRFNFFPKTFYPFPPFVVRLVSLFTPFIYWLDSLLSAIPFLNQLCNSNEYFAKAKSVLR